MVVVKLTVVIRYVAFTGHAKVSILEEVMVIFQQLLYINSLIIFT